MQTCRKPPLKFAVVAAAAAERLWAEHKRAARSKVYRKPDLGPRSSSHWQLTFGDLFPGFEQFQKNTENCK